MIRIITLAISALSMFASANTPALEYPSCLQSNIDFWYEIYTKYTKNDLIVYNKKTMEIYEVYKLSSDNPKTLKKLKKQLIFKHSNNLSKSDRKNISVNLGAQGIFEKGLERMTEHYSTIAQILEENKMPTQIAFLPFVESAYSAQATSRAGAVGMWQIMPATGRLFGIKKKKALRDVKVATKTAIKILKFNYEQLGNWSLAINAYHSGVGRLLKASNMANSKDICEILNFMDKNDVTVKGYKFHSRNYIAQLFAIEQAVTERLEGDEGESEDVGEVGLDGTVGADTSLGGSEKSTSNQGQ